MFISSISYPNFFSLYLLNSHSILKMVILLYFYYILIFVVELSWNLFQMCNNNYLLKMILPGNEFSHLKGVNKQPYLDIGTYASHLTNRCLFSCFSLFSFYSTTFSTFIQ